MLFAIKAVLQPSCCPIKVPNGTPVTVATVRPVNIIEIALAPRFSGTKSATMVEPIDMKTPCENAEITRAANNNQIVVEIAATALPIIKTIIIQSNKVLRGIFDVNNVKIGAPNVTPKAYKETVNPAVVMGILKSFAIRGSNPTLMNSVVPIAKALMAKASNAQCTLLYS